MATVAYQPMVYVVRGLHFVIGIAMTAATGYLWYAALFGVFGNWTTLTLAALLIQWIIIALNHGHCPLGAVHHRYGDEKTLFELVAGKQYAANGFRNWGVICVLGLLLLSARLVLRFGTRRPASLTRTHGRKAAQGRNPRCQAIDSRVRATTCGSATSERHRMILASTPRDAFRSVDMT